MTFTPQKCRLASKSRKVKITAFDENFDVPIEFDVKTQSNFNDGQGVSSTIECTSGQIKHYTFETLMQRVNLTYNYGTKEVSNRDRKKLSISIINGGWLRNHYSGFKCIYLGHSRNLCDDKNSHTKCKNVALSFDNGSKGKSIFFLSKFKDTGKRMNLKVRVFPESYELCGKPERLCKTIFESLFVNYQGSFAMQLENYEQRNLNLTHISFRLTTLARFLIRL